MQESTEAIDSTTATQDGSEAISQVTSATGNLSIHVSETVNGNGGQPKVQDGKKLSEIQNIAYHASPPTVPASREEPLTNHLKRTDPFQFGSRYLEEQDDVFAWNAWDHVDPTKDAVFVAYAEAQYAFQKANAVSDFDRGRFNAEPQKWWDKFYSNNNANFFKDRKWLRQEFPTLAAATTASAEEAKALISELGEHSPASDNAAKCLNDGPWNTILEVGAGAGNTAFPLARQNTNPKLMIHACDFSLKAVKLIQSSLQFVPQHMTASQWDMASTSLPEGLLPGSADLVVMVFAFSALAPQQWRQAVRNVWEVLRPGGEVCFRDYGRGDLAQVRFKKGRLLEENFYVRGDGTRVYFFEEEELRRIWDGRVAELIKPDSDASDDTATEHEASKFRFDIISLATDRRLLVNRQKRLKMYRCWQQGHFRKPI